MAGLETISRYWVIPGEPVMLRPPSKALQRTRIATATDAERVVALYDEFTRYLRRLGDTTVTHLTSDIYRRDGFGPNPAFFGLVAECDGEVIGYLLYHFGYGSELAARTMFVIDLS